MSWEDLQEVLLSSWNWPEHSPPHPLPILCGSLLCVCPGKREVSLPVGASVYQVGSGLG